MFNGKLSDKSPVADLVSALESDPEYRRGWVANIAMAFVDNYNWYFQHVTENPLKKEDLHAIANKAAEHFLQVLCMRPEEASDGPKQEGGGAAPHVRRCSKVGDVGGVSRKSPARGGNTGGREHSPSEQAVRGVQARRRSRRQARPSR